MTRTFDAVVIGAGPYGLAVSAELRRTGADVHVFGDAMSFWMRQMPKGMCLRSSWSASHIGDPNSPLNLNLFAQDRAGGIARPIPIADFIAYGHWFKAQALPDLDPRSVTRVEAMADGFRLTLADGESIQVRRVIVAAGIAPFAARPAMFDGLSPDHASHSVEHADLARFAGRRVVVIGGGQSATESAVLLQENGAEVEMLMRARNFRWVGRAPREGVFGPILFDRTDVGPAFVSHLVAHPMVVRALPRAMQRDAARRALAPGASLWLRPRMGGLVVSMGRHVVDVAQRDGRVHLRLDDGSSREVDHVLMATGYRVDIRRYPFLAPELVARVRCVEGHPVLDTGFETSVPGLHFVGAPAMYSFGPLLRFVSGTEFAARMVKRRVTSGRPAPRETEPAVELQRATH
jgi:pyridine nucleotide-disulfide oxidoreductase